MLGWHGKCFWLTVRQVTLKGFIGIGLRCRSNNISKVFISSIGYSTKIDTVLIQRSNRAPYDECRGHGFTFVDNCVVTENDLSIDGIHLLESGKRIIANNLMNSFNHFFRICRYVQVVSMKESFLLSESEKVRQNTLEANKECYSEESLTDKSEKKSINTSPNSLSKIKELRIGNANKVIKD